MKMKNRFRLFVSLSIILSVFFASNVYAYVLLPDLPTTKTFTWGYHETLPTDGQLPARSNGNWDKSDGLSATYNFNTYSGTINASDSNNSVGGRVPSLPGGSTSFIGATLVPSGGYSTFDIVINSNKTYGNGSTQTYFDYQGVFAHEFGHVYGLADLYTTSPEVVGTTKSTVPTMYGKSAYDGTTNIYYYLRTVQTDDNNGKHEVANSI